MHPDRIARFIIETYADVNHAKNDGDSFFIYDPGRALPPERQWPFATIVTKDNDFDAASQLNREGVFRLNVGVGKATFVALFGPPPAPVDPANQWAVRSDIDFTALDTLMPHPMYGRMYWVSVLNPGEATFARKVRPLLDEAYAIVVRRHGSATRSTESE